jgi:hypothetical protein
VATAQPLPNKLPVLPHAAMQLRAGDQDCEKRFAGVVVAADITGMVALRTLSRILNASGYQNEAIKIGLQAAPLTPANAELRLHPGADASNPATYHVANGAAELCRLVPAATAVSRHPRSYRSASFFDVSCEVSSDGY